MLQIAVFAVVLVAVYAVKAFAVARKHQELAAQSVSFSWMHPRKEALAVLAATAQKAKPAARTQRPQFQMNTSSMRRVGGVGA